MLSIFILNTALAYLP